MPASFPWAIVGILSDDEQTRIDTMAGLKAFFNLLVLVETSRFAERPWILKTISVFKWQMVREMCEAGASSDFTIISEHLLKLAKDFYQVGSSLSLELCFNDLRDLERRGRKNLGTTTTEMHVDQVRSVKKRYADMPQVLLEETDFADTGYYQDKHMDASIFTTKKMKDSAVGVDTTPLAGATTWSSTTPEKFSNMCLTLITALLMLGDLSRASRLWMACLFCRGMVVSKNDQYYMIIFSSLYLFKAWPLILIEGAYVLDTSPAARVVDFLCTSLTEWNVHEYLIKCVGMESMDAAPTCIFFEMQGVVTLTVFVCKHTICNLSSETLKKLGSALGVPGLPDASTLVTKVGRIMTHLKCESAMIDQMVRLAGERSKKRGWTDDDVDDDDADTVNPTVTSLLTKADQQTVAGRSRGGDGSDDSEQEDDQAQGHVANGAGVNQFTTPKLADHIPAGCRWQLDMGGKKAGQQPPYWVIYLPRWQEYKGYKSHSESFNNGTPGAQGIDQSETIAVLNCCAWAWDWVATTPNYIPTPVNLETAKREASSSSAGPSGVRRRTN